MKNFIQINGRQIELTEEQAKELAEVYGAKPTALSEIPVGGTFFVAGREFVVLEHTEQGTAAILKGLLKDMEFGDNNNFAESRIIEECRVFGEELEEDFGRPILVGHEVDLISDDGLKDYDTAPCKCSVLTADLYRRYVEVLDLHKVDRWWWLATPYSTPRHEDDSWVKCVAPSGRISNCNYLGFNGVRPFCIFNSSIFVSC
jgi:hypothetical protein